MNQILITLNVYEVGYSSVMRNRISYVKFPIAPFAPLAKDAVSYDFVHVHPCPILFFGHSG